MNEAGNSGSGSGSEVFDTFDICFFKSSFLAAARGSVFGNKASKDARTNRISAKMIQPSHQAPSHLGSLLVIVGVKVGETYSFKQKEASPKPIAGPSILREYEKPIRRRNIVLR